MQKIRLGVIGCGHWGPNHIRVFNSLSDCELVAILDHDSARLKKIGSSYNDVAFTTDFNDFLNKKLDAAVVATPTSTHYPIVKTLFERGIHVLCEKPLTLYGKESEELVNLAEQKKLTLMVGHIYLYNSAINKLKEIIDAGELGKLYFLTMKRLNLGPIREDVGAIYDLASHDISIVQYLFGNVIKDVSVRAGFWLGSNREDAAFITLGLHNDIIVNIEVSWLSPKKIRNITIVGSKKMAVFNENEPSFPIVVYDKGALVTQDYNDYGEFLKISMWENDAYMPKFRIEEPLRIQDKHFLDCVKDGKKPLCDGRFALEVVKVLDKIQILKKQTGK